METRKYTDQFDTNQDNRGNLLILFQKIDSDNDTIGDNSDNCPDTPNSNQSDLDGDGIGDACDNFDEEVFCQAAGFSWNLQKNTCGEDLSTICSGDIGSWNPNERSCNWKEEIGDQNDDSKIDLEDLMILKTSTTPEKFKSASIIIIYYILSKE